MNSLINSSNEPTDQFVLPKFLIIGVQKGGTTTLFDILNRVPGLCGSDEKETCFFSKSQLYQQGARWYAQRFRHGAPQKICFEATPAYIYNRDVPSRIHSFNPEMKFIVVFREPAARCYSAWNMFRRFREGDRDAIFRHFTRFSDAHQKEVFAELLFAKDFPSFGKAVEDDIERHRTGCIDIEPSFVRRGVYHEQISRYLKFFDISNFLFVEQRELNEIKFLSPKLSGFLGIDIDIPALGEPIASNIGEYKVREVADEIVLQELRHFYSPHNHRLFEAIGRRFSW